MPPSRPLEERFWEKVIKGRANECWIWQASIDSCGYGTIRVGRTHDKAHRVSYFLATGQKPGSSHVLHACDTPPCVNPRHLFLGTHADNMRDRLKKGRHPSSQKTHCKYGHEYTTENTGRSKNQRWCRECKRRRGLETYYKKRAA